MQEMLISILEDRAGILERKIHAGLQLLSAVHSAFTLHSIYYNQGSYQHHYQHTDCTCSCISFPYIYKYDDT